VNSQRVSFSSDGIELVGILRTPEGSSGERLPALVFTGPLTGVKEQVVSNYAERLTQDGFATLVFDHRNFGESGGVRRQHEDPGGKLDDLRDAVSFLATRPEIDPERIGACGVCLGGGYTLRAGAFDTRIRSVAVVRSSTASRRSSVSRSARPNFNESEQ
jgi:dienelactone hydrolase